MDDDNYFAMPSDAPPPLPTDGGVAPLTTSMDAFTIPESSSEQYVGDVDETPRAADHYDDFAAFATAASGPPLSSSSYDDYNAFAEPALGSDAAPPPSSWGSAAPDAAGTDDSDYHFAGGPADSDAPILLGAAPDDYVAVSRDGEGDMALQLPEPEPVGPPEPSPMQKWNEEFQETLHQRREAENARKGEMVEAARVAMEEFHAAREARRDAKMAKNREDEQAKLEAIERDLENDNSWQRVCKMVELTHDSTKQAADVKRMRDILILLKNDTTRAQVLGN